MREATGGAMLLYLLIPIILIFVVFIGFVMNYASAYRSANYLVTQIETCQSMSSCDHTSFEQMKAEIKDKYHYGGPVDCKCSNNARGAVCSVTLEVNLWLPIIEDVGAFKVKSETKTMYAANGTSIC